jgi:hypothetical protein
MAQRTAQSAVVLKREMSFIANHTGSHFFKERERARERERESDFVEKKRINWNLMDSVIVLTALLCSHHP